MCNYLLISWIYLLKRIVPKLDPIGVVTFVVSPPSTNQMFPNTLSQNMSHCLHYPASFAIETLKPEKVCGNMSYILVKMYKHKILCILSMYMCNLRPMAVLKHNAKLESQTQDFAP